MPDNLKDAPIEQLLKWNNSEPGEANRFKLVMLHRTIEAMNGLSNRLDKMAVQAKESGEAQDRQQSAIKWLTGVLAVCTVLYTVTSGLSVYEAHAANKLQAVTQSKTQQARNGIMMDQYVWVGRNSDQLALVASKGVDVNGQPALCVNGTAYNLPVNGSNEIAPKEENGPASINGVPVVRPFLKCK